MTTVTVSGMRGCLGVIALLHDPAIDADTGFVVVPRAAVTGVRGGTVLVASSYISNYEDRIRRKLHKFNCRLDDGDECAYSYVSLFGPEEATLARRAMAADIVRYHLSPDCRVCTPIVLASLQDDDMRCAVRNLPIANVIRRMRRKRATATPSEASRDPLVIALARYMAEDGAVGRFAQRLALAAAVDDNRYVAAIGASLLGGRPQAHAKPDGLLDIFEPNSTNYPVPW